jgi:hypothetical protein
MEIDIVYETREGKLVIHAKGFMPFANLHFDNVKRNMKDIVIRRKGEKIIKYFKPNDYEVE